MLRYVLIFLIGILSCWISLFNDIQHFFSSFWIVSSILLFLGICLAAFAQILKFRGYSVPNRMSNWVFIIISLSLTPNLLIFITSFEKFSVNSRLTEVDQTYRSKSIKFENLLGIENVNIRIKHKYFTTIETYPAAPNIGDFYCVLGRKGPIGFVVNEILPAIACTPKL